VGKTLKLTVKLKACKRCHAIVPAHMKVCPKCGSTEFGTIEGMVVVFDPERSVIAKLLKINAKGIYAQRVRDR